MNEFWHRFCTNRRWFLGTITVLFLVFLFFWRIISPTGFATTINGFFHDLWEIVRGLLTLAIVCAGVGIMFGWKPFRKKKSGH